MYLTGQSTVLFRYGRSKVLSLSHLSLGFECSHWVSLVYPLGDILEKGTKSSQGLVVCLWYLTTGSLEVKGGGNDLCCLPISML